jgi:hypothetical protein
MHHHRFERGPVTGQLAVALGQHRGHPATNISGARFRPQNVRIGF